MLAPGGLRFGEALARKWRDIYPVKRELKISAIEYCNERVRFVISWMKRVWIPALLAIDIREGVGRVLAMVRFATGTGVSGHEPEARNPNVSWHDPRS